MDNSLVIIDGHSLMNRAYYAIQKPMITHDGMYTHGIYGFINMLNKILTDYDPQYIAVAFDMKSPTFRHKEYSGYKAGRRKMPLELNMQFPVLHDVLGAMNIAILETEGYEADDILGTVTFEAENKGISSFVITGDKDALQLASDMTTIIYTKRGTTDFDAYDKKAFTEKYGFTPTQFIDFKGLRGDTSDNIPGIPGVGEKTASKLIIEYGSVENLIANADSMKKGKLRDSIEEYAQQAVMSKRLATIMRNIPLELDFEAMKREEPDYDELVKIYKKLEFNSFIKKIISSNKGINAASQTIAPKTSRDNSFTDISEVSADAEIAVISDAASLKKGLEKLLQRENIWLKVFHDNNHLHKPEIQSVCMACGNEVFLTEWKSEFAGIFADFFENYRGGICGHDLKQDYYALLSASAAVKPKNGGELSGQEREPIFKESVFNTRFDTAIAAYLIDPQKKTYELSVCMMDVFMEEFPEDKELQKDISAVDMFGEHLKIQGETGRRMLSAASRLAPYYAEELERLELTDVFERAELPLEEVLASMEESGIKADPDMLRIIGGSLSERIEELTKMIHAFAGTDFNINSPKQLGEVLFERLELPYGKKTKTGYSTNADVLNKLKEKHPIIPLILEYRMFAKLKNTYVDGLLPLINEDGYIHAHFQQTATATGRLSCTEPNLQNIPVRQEIGRVFRKVFVSSSDSSQLVGADYSQVELRVTAHLSGDENLIAAFGEGENTDIHTSTAAKVFEVDESEVTKEMRSRAKAVNFGVIYGISAFGLSQDLGTTQKEAQSYIDEYFRKYPSVRRFMDDMVEQCRKKGYVSTILGRRREIREISSGSAPARQQGERLAMNTPVQGSAADVIKLAMIKTYRRLLAENCASRLVLQVHDELIVDACEDEIEKVKKILEESMENAVKLKVPLVADVGSGHSWYELK